MHTWTPEHDAAIQDVLDYVTMMLKTPKDTRWGVGFTPTTLGGLTTSVTPDGEGIDTALRLFTDVVVPSCRPNDSPGMLSYVPTAPTLESRMLDVAMSAATLFGAHWDAGAGAIAAENAALSYLAAVAGFPTTAGGTFVSGGSAANLSALVTARHHWREQNGRGVPLRMAVSEEAHSSLLGCAHVMDVELAMIPTTPDGTMETDALREVLAADHGSLFAVVATAGTTARGAVDDLATIGALAREHGVWLHVDAAYGGGALCAPSARPLFAGIEEADSLTLDPHKWFFAPYDCAALLYREPRLASDAHAQRANYLAGVAASTWNPSDYAFQLSRRARGLPFWFSLVANGTEAYAEAVEQTLDTARWFADLVSGSEHLRLMEPPTLSIVLFSRVGWEHQDYLDWSVRISQAGQALVQPIVVGTQTYARVCIVNPLTTHELLEGVVASLA